MPSTISNPKIVPEIREVPCCCRITPISWITLSISAVSCATCLFMAGAYGVQNVQSILNEVNGILSHSEGLIFAGMRGSVSAIGSGAKSHYGSRPSPGQRGGGGECGLLRPRYGVVRSPVLKSRYPGEGRGPSMAFSPRSAGGNMAGPRVEPEDDEGERASRDLSLRRGALPSQFVMAGLDPAIQRSGPHAWRALLDPRVEPGDDDGRDRDARTAGLGCGREGANGAGVTVHCEGRLDRDRPAPKKKAPARGAFDGVRVTGIRACARPFRRGSIR